MFAVESLIDAPLLLFRVFAIQGDMEEAVEVAFEMAVEFGRHRGVKLFRFFNMMAQVHYIAA